MPLAQRSAGCAIAAIAAIAAHADRGAYIGVRASGNAYDVDYSKAVDNTSPVHIGTHAGRVFRSAAATDGATWDAGLSAGYRLPFDAFYVDLEADAVLHRRSVSSRLAGRGTSPGRDQLGELWPENWSLEKSRSFGITARLGTDLPTFGVSVHVLAGVRRLVGAGIEKSLGRASVRAELRYTDHGEATRTVSLPDSGVSVPFALETTVRGLALAPSMTSNNAPVPFHRRGTRCPETCKSATWKTTSSRGSSGAPPGTGAPWRRNIVRFCAKRCPRRPSRRSGSLRPSSGN